MSKIELLLPTSWSALTAMPRGELTADQQRELEMAFNSTPNPEQYHIYQMHVSTKIPVRDIQDWFARKRAEQEMYAQPMPYPPGSSTGFSLNVQSPSTSVPPALDSGQHGRHSRLNAGQFEKALQQKSFLEQPHSSDTSYLSSIKNRLKCNSGSSASQQGAMCATPDTQTRFRPSTSTAGPLPPASSSPYPTGRFQQSQQMMISQGLELPTVMTHPIPGGSRAVSVRQAAGEGLPMPDAELTSVGSAPPRLHGSQKRKRTYLQEVHESTTRPHVHTPFGVDVGPPSYHTRASDGYATLGPSKGITGVHQLSLMQPLMCTSSMPAASEPMPIMQHELPVARSITGDSCQPPSRLQQATPRVPSPSAAHHSPLVNPYANLEVASDGDDGRFGESELPILTSMLGLQSITAADGGQSMYLFEQLTYLDSAAPEEGGSASKKRRTRHQHFWRNSDKFPRAERRYAPSKEVKSALTSGAPVAVKLDIAGEERTNHWTVVLTRSGTVNFINRKIGPLGVRLFRAALGQRQGLASPGSRGRAGWSFAGAED